MENPEDSIHGSSQAEAIYAPEVEGCTWISGLLVVLYFLIVVTVSRVSFKSFVPLEG
jgi:hypothetical protein